MSEQNKDIVRKYDDEVLNGRNHDAVSDAYFTAFPDLRCSLDELTNDQAAVPAAGTSSS